MTANGLGVSDVGIKETIGGVALDFFRRLGVTQRLRTNGILECHPGARGAHVWRHARGRARAGRPGRPPAGARAVTQSGGRISQIAMVDGRLFRGRVFIDASYEGDLMAQAGVSFTVGREASSQYGESLAGVQPPQQELPAMTAMTPGGGLAPGVDGGQVGPIGSADGHIQPYTFRLCVTTDRANQVPFPRPDGYDPARYLLVQRHLQALQDAGRPPAWPTS